ncbi:MAG: hypothetical protein DRJ55_01500 [Thermoprotei archaeon]|nr:MAG: hypothetical protein DRJ55_01500 [Thermoprotei archaeon]
MFGESRLVGVSATRLEHTLDRLATVIIVLLIFSTFLGPSPVSQPSPNLEVTGELYLRGETLNVAGNVTVRSGGRLLLINSTLRFVGDGRHFFVVEAGGELFLNRSTVTGPEGSYTIFVERGAKFSAVYSVIENAGWKDHRDDGNYIWIGPAFTVDYSTYGHGLEVNTTVKLFRGNTLRNIASVRFYSSGNVIEDNLVVNMRHEGIAFVGSNDNVVKGNTFRDAALNRETYGLKFYPGTKNQLIANNTFQNLSIGIFVSLVPPWKAGENFTITGNRMRRVVQGLVAKLRDSVVKGEDYRNVWSVGVFLAASQNVVVEDCTIENLTLYDESIASEEYFQEAEPYIHPKLPRAYYNFLLLLRGAIQISWSGRNITIRRNKIAYVPPYGYGVAFDVKYIAYDVKIVNNTFTHIGDFQPPWNISNPGLGSVPLDQIGFTPPGAAIELESTENLLIKNNTLKYCLNGILTSFPDAIGNYGNLTIEGNELQGLQSARWKERGRMREWKGIGIGVGTRAYRPQENNERYRIYSSKAEIRILSNRVENFTYALVIDIDNPELKKATVENNTFLQYSEVKVPAYVNLSRNTLMPSLPDLKIANLTVTVSGREATIIAEVAVEPPQPPAGKIAVEVTVDNQTITKELALNSSKLYTIKHTANLTSGEHVIRVAVDPANKIKEKDEDNNTAIAKIEVKEESQTGEKQPKGELLETSIAALVVLAALIAIIYLARKNDW